MLSPLDPEVPDGRSGKAERAAVRQRLAAGLRLQPSPMIAATTEPTSAAPVQCQQNIADRQAEINNIQAALNGLAGLAGGAAATPAQIQEHDGLLGAGQHHRNRNVTIAQLRGDYQGRIDTLNGYNVRDNAAILLPRNRARVAQLARED